MVHRLAWFYSFLSVFLQYPGLLTCNLETILGLFSGVTYECCVMSAIIASLHVSLEYRSTVCHGIQKFKMSFRCFIRGKGTIRRA